jgi:hypothetical protein
VQNLLNQDFKDFEIIIGNDYIENFLSSSSLNIFDERVKFINNVKNLGELDNMNFLLQEAKGKYFTWQFDDDPCLPNFLRKIATAITKYNNPECIFTNFQTLYGDDEINLNFEDKNNDKCFTGKEFLKKYLDNKLQALGCCGFYRLDYLKRLGGVTRLSKGKMALFSEYLLLVNQGLADKVVYIASPMVSTRHHSGSWTYSNDNYDLFWEAGLNYLRKSLTILTHENLIQDFQQNFHPIIKSIIGAVAVKAWQKKKFNAIHDMKEYNQKIKLEILNIKNQDIQEKAIKALNNTSKNYSAYFIKSMFKKNIPLWAFSFFEKKSVSLRRLSNRNF